MNRFQRGAKNLRAVLIAQFIRTFHFIFERKVEIFRSAGDDLYQVQGLSGLRNNGVSG